MTKSASTKKSKTPTGRNELHCTCALVRRSARKITQTYDNALKETGLRITQYSILANLEDEKGLSITDLADVLEMDRTTLTRNLRPLQRDGLVNLAHGPDNRSKALSISPEGREVLKVARPIWRRTEKAVRQTIEVEELAELRRLLKRVVAAP